MSDPTRHSAVEELRRAMAGRVESGAVPGLVWLVAHAGEVYSGSAGVLDLETSRPVTRRSIFRISSTTKPITAACAMTLVDEGVIGLDDPVTDLLPELVRADRARGPRRTARRHGARVARHHVA